MIQKLERRAPVSRRYDVLRSQAAQHVAAVPVLESLVLDNQERELADVPHGINLPAIPESIHFGKPEIAIRETLTIVEPRGARILLIALGCPLVQGYFVARPMDAGEFLDWIPHAPADDRMSP
jgi:hypothetical protein